MKRGESGPPFWQQIAKWSAQTIVGLGAALAVLVGIRARIEDRGFLLPDGTLDALMMFARFAVLLGLSCAATGLVLGLLFGFAPKEPKR